MPKLNISAMTVLNRIQRARLPDPVQEFQFYPERKWRFDFCWLPDMMLVSSYKGLRKVAIEFDGGVWRIGRHNRPAGFIKDLEKINCATVMGWKVLRYCGDNIDQMVPDLKSLLNIPQQG